MSGDADVGAADTLLPGPEQRLGRYHLRMRVGAGAMGVVHLAHDPQLDRRVAIKLLHARHVLTPGAADRLLREAKAMARLRHPNVIAVYDAGQDGDRVYVVMELIGGSTLGALLRQRTDAERADWRRWIPMLLDAGRGLAAAHAAGILHRDFKPDNVLVDADGRVCVGDFGLADVAAGAVTTPPSTTTEAHADALALDETAVPPADAMAATITTAPGDARLTTTGAVMGTPAYMAPEQLAGRTVDARADQFSLCVALFEALAGRRPFEIDDPGQLGALPRLREEIVAGRIGPLPATVPRWLATAVRRGLAADPDRRWPSIAALLEHVERRLRPARRGPLVAGIAAIAVAGGAAAAWIAWPSGSAAPAAGAPDGGLAVLGSPRRLPAPPTTHGIAVAGDRLLVWTDRRVSVRTLVDDAARDERSYDADDATTVTCATLGPDRRALLVLATEPGAWQASWWSPDDRALEPVLGGDHDRDVVGCVAGNDGAIGLLEARTDGAHALVWGDRAGERWRLEVPDAYTGDFELVASPDRRRAAIVVGGGPDQPARIGVIDLADGTVRWRLEWPWIHAVTWRDDRRLWFASGLHPGTLHEVTADGTDAPRAFLERDETWMHSLAITADGDLLMLVASELKGARVLSLDGGAVRELDPHHGVIAWSDTGSLSIIDRVSGETWRVDDGARRQVPGATMPAGVPLAGWFTRAGDVIIAMRIEGDDLTCRMEGLSSIDGSTRWSLPDCTSGVRCAGDATAPCVIVPSGATGPTSIRWFDPERGVPGAEVVTVQLAPGANVDAALSPDGRTLAIADGSNVVRTVSLRAAGAVVRDLALDPGLAAQDVAAGPRGQLYVAGGDATAEVYRILSVTDDGATVVASSPTTGFYALRLSPDGRSLAANTWDESRLLELLDVR